MSAVLDTQEAEAGGSLEPGRRRLQSAEIKPLRSSLGKRARLLSQKKRERERQQIFAGRGLVRGEWILESEGQTE